MAWSYKRTITIDHTKVSSDQTNFPVLVRLDSTNVGTTFKTTGNGGYIQNTNGYDIAFYSDSAGTSPLYWEIDNYDGSNGVFLAWVKIPNLSSSSDNTIYVFYGDATINTFQSTVTSVWDANFCSVYHLPDGSTLSASDSTGTNNGTLVGSPTAVAGKISGGGSLNGSSQSININHPSSFNFGSGDFTLECWVYETDLTVKACIIGKDQEVGRQFTFVVNEEGNGALRLMICPDDSHYLIRGTSSGIVSVNTWTYIVAQRSGSSIVIYANGNSQSVSDTGSSNVNFPLTMASTSTNAYIGQRTFSGYNYWYKGYVDEVRLSNTARSSGWVVTCYNNQNSPLTFLSSVSAQSSVVTPIGNEVLQPISQPTGHYKIEFVM